LCSGRRAVLDGADAAADADRRRRCGDRDSALMA
jgi:hypothetical protein